MCEMSESKRERRALTYDGGASCFAVLFEELEKFVADKNIKVDGDFVKKKDIPRGHKTHAELDAAPFSIRNVVHAPVEINV
jgi:hypothetical protein